MARHTALFVYESCVREDLGYEEDGQGEAVGEDLGVVEGGAMGLNTIQLEVFLFGVVAQERFKFLQASVQLVIRLLMLAACGLVCGGVRVDVAEI